MDFQFEPSPSRTLQQQPVIEEVRTTEFATWPMRRLRHPRWHNAFSTSDVPEARTRDGLTISAWVSARADELLLVVVLGAVAAWLFFWFGP
ncbi:hypothetical protein [Variovorax atrisoli]|uniref:hypothetical protein n=1 Tax=Variovorax TaxID=34072 RepID=UPI00035D817B|nr:hypothetical protein [Variovorax paradoxus]MDR6522331.1 hypothetical protein [Variovorax paradoxus]